MQKHPETLEELYPALWLKASDLHGKTALVTITDATLETIYGKIAKAEQQKIVLTFEGKSKRMILNKTQAATIAAITGDPRWANWKGLKIRIFPTVAPNRQPTIGIQAIE